MYVFIRSQDAVKHYKLHHFKNQGVYVFGEATFYSLKELLEHFESKPLVGTDGSKYYEIFFFGLILSSF